MFRDSTTILFECLPLALFVSHLPLQLKFVLLLDFVQQFSHAAKLFNNFPFVLCESLDFCCCCGWWGHSESFVDVVACDTDVAVALISVGFVDSSSLSGSPFRLTTLISTSTPCSFEATDYHRHAIWQCHY